MWSQSPSLRGSGRFLTALSRRTAGGQGFQSPSLRGSGRFSTRGVGPQPGRRLSIPFIAGQWSLLTDPDAPWIRFLDFQSPSLRGSGRFPPRRGGASRLQFNFQSPSLRGSGRFRKEAERAQREAEAPFNPLHCGAVVASRDLVNALRRVLPLSIPFIAGQWSLRKSASSTRGRSSRLSIPFIAGQWSLHPRTTPSSLFGVLLRKRRLPCDHIICTRLPF